MENGKEIKKEDLVRKLEELLKTVKPGDLRGIQQKIGEHLKFAVDNYDRLASDAKEATDNTLKIIQGFIGETLKKVPESKERRKLKRSHAISLGDHYQIEQFIKILEQPPMLKDENSKQFRSIFVTTLQNIIDFLFDIEQNTLNGPANFGQVGLLHMCVNELLVTLHLTQHHYITQAYSHIRTTFENLDKVELFRRKPEWAEVWCGDDEKRIKRELLPSAVRKKLGRNSRDPVYELFSKLGPHGTFHALKTQSSKGVRDSSAGNPQINIWIGGCPFEHNIVFVNGFGLCAVNSVLSQVMKSFGNFLNNDESIEILEQSARESNKYMENNFLPWAKANGLDVEETEKSLKIMIGVIHEVVQKAKSAIEEEKLNG